MSMNQNTEKFYKRANQSEFSGISIHDSDEEDERLHVDIKALASNIDESCLETEFFASDFTDLHNQLI